MRSLGITVLSLAAVFLIEGSSGAAVFGPVYPAPGGNNFVGSGASEGPASSPGRTNSYSAFDPTQIPNLYWGKSSAAPITLTLDGTVDSPGETLGAPTILGNLARWSGSSDIPLAAGGSQPVLTRFTLTATDAANQPISFTTPSSVDPTFPSSADAVLKVPGDFKVNLFFEASSNGGSTWFGANDLYNQFATPAGASANVKSNFSGAFYSVPEPGSLALLGIACTSLLRRRRRS